MKFEQVLQIYWSKGFLYNGRIVTFKTTLGDFFKSIGGFQNPTKKQIVKRFELHLLYRNPFLYFLEYDKDLRKSINILLSQISSVNNQVSEINKYNLLRLYLIKCFRGRGQALGKPVRGQRTWSNAWTSYHYNKTIRTFVSSMQRALRKSKKDEVINYKVLKKVVKKTKRKTTVQKKKKLNASWF